MEIRTDLHNKHYFKRGFTKAANDWNLKLKFEAKTKNEALYLERFIKRMKRKTFIEKIIYEPSILVEILKKKK